MRLALALFGLVIIVGVIASPPARAQNGESVAAAEARHAEVATRSGVGANLRAAPRVETGNVVGSAANGARVEVLETADQGDYFWYRVRVVETRLEGWIRGDLLTPVEGMAEADSATIEQLKAAEAAGPAEARLPPFEEREDWTRHFFQIYPALESCLKVSSAQPGRALQAKPLRGELVDILVEDGAGRHWQCIIRETGGTPVRFDPLASSRVERAVQNSPTFITRAEGEPPEEGCTIVEPVSIASAAEPVGWLVHEECP